LVHWHHQRSPGGGGGATATANILPANQPLTAVADAYSVVHDRTLHGNVHDNDSDPGDAALTTVRVLDQSHGTRTLNDDGSFTYSPNAGFVGTDQFTDKNEDGSTPSNTATVTITVTDSPPVAVDDAFSAAEGQTIRGNVRASDQNPDRGLTDEPGPHRAPPSRGAAAALAQ
jgi:VCBS repeat-containing protein